jgi:hypothetical protein
VNREDVRPDAGYVPPAYGRPQYRPPRTGRAPDDSGGRRLRLTPGRLLVLAAIVGSIGLVGYGLVRRDRTQIPLLAAGMIILGITLVGAGFWAARAAWLDARRGQTGSAFIGALFGGLCVLAGSGSLATAIVLALIWETA